MNVDRFCEQCDIDLELHPDPDNEDDPGCEIAKQRVNLIVRFLSTGDHP